MPWTSKHLKWLVKTEGKLTTADGKTIEIWEFRHEKDEAILSAWAKHFRNHYCLDTEIDDLRNGTPCSRAEYLNQIKFPDDSHPPGPSIRAGDFGEVLIADFLQYVLNFWVPRTHYGNKAVRNESTKGCDVIGFKFVGNGQNPKNDMLTIWEAKTQFSGNKANPRLQDAVNGSAKDFVRKAESLNAIKQRLLDKLSRDEARKVERFQNPEDRPYRETYGAAALFLTSLFENRMLSSTDSSKHPDPNNLSLLVIHGETMMDLVHDLYRRAASEA